MKTAYMIGGLCAIVALVGGYIYFGKKTEVSAEESAHIMLYKEYGFITWKNKDDTEYKRVEADETEIPNNAYVKTVEGRGYIIMPDNSSISLDTNTEIRISYNPEGTSILQMLGSTYHRVESLVAGRTYEVRTPNTLATVRGTKLMVTYDDKKKVSKVDVTEHIVEIVNVGLATSTPTAVSEGATAIIGGTSTQPVDVKETKDIKERNDWFEENKAIDQVIDKGGNKRETIKGIIDILRKTDADGNKDTTRLDEVKRALQKVEDMKGQIKSESRKEPENTLPKVVLVKDTPDEPLIKDDTKKVEEVKKDIEKPLPIKKIDEETFFDKFNTMFVDNFYLDEKDGACNGTPPEQKVAIVTKYATESGYPFASRTLLSFAQAIDAYCKDKDAATKTKLEERFDVEFPFND